MSDPLAVGSHALAVSGLAKGFAAVLGAHRFFANEAATLPCLLEPLQRLALAWRQQASTAWGLVIHDWSLLRYPAHQRKTDQVEHGKQQEGEALAKRLVGAAMACALVWRLERHPSAEAGSLRALLVQLSGRQMKHGRSSTVPALLAGLWVFLAMLEVLQTHSLEELQRFKHLVLGTDEENPKRPGYL